MRFFWIGFFIVNWRIFIYIRVIINFFFYCLESKNGIFNLIEYNCIVCIFFILILVFYENGMEWNEISKEVFNWKF